MRIRHLAFGLALLSTIALAACGGSREGDSPQVTATDAAAITEEALSDAETQYLEQVAAMDNQIGDKVDAIDEALSMTWPTRGRLLSVLRDADFGGTFEALSQEAEQLNPPDRFGTDHELYLQTLRDSFSLSRDFDQAIEDEDLVGVFLAITEASLARTRLLLEASPAFCDAALRSDLSPGCESAEPPPGGAYGSQLRAIFRHYVTEFGPRVGAFPPAYTSEERFAALEALQPDIINALKEGLESVQALEPPAELRADHDRMIQYFEETLDVSRAIPQATEDRDFAKTEEEFQRSGTVFCSAVQDLSPAVKPIVAFFFDPDECAGEPF